MEEIVLNKLEKEIIGKIREHTQHNFIGYKKEVIEKPNNSRSGIKKGKKFTNSSGVKVDITMKKENEMKDYINNQILNYEKQRLTRYFPLIEEEVKEKFDVNLSRAYLCNIKKRIENGS
jgi:ethanolamine ammonia-lyase large subunit